PARPGLRGCLGGVGAGGGPRPRAAGPSRPGSDRLRRGTEDRLLRWSVAVAGPALAHAARRAVLRAPLHAGVRAARGAGAPAGRAPAADCATVRPQARRAGRRRGWGAPAAAGQARPAPGPLSPPPPPPP